MSGKALSNSVSKPPEIDSGNSSANKKADKFSRSPKRGDNIKDSSPDCKEKTKSMNRFQKPPLDSKDPELPKPPPVSRHDFVKENIERVKRISTEQNLPEEKVSEILASESSEAKLSQIPFKQKTSKRSSLDRPSDQSPALTLHTEESPQLIKDLDTLDKIGKGYTNKLKNLEVKDIAIEEMLKPKESYERVQILEEEKKLNFRRNSASKVKIERVEKSPAKRNTSKPPERSIVNEIVTAKLKSQEVLAKKFTKEFEKIIKDLELQSDEIDLNNTKTILSKLEFIKNEPGSSAFDNEVIQVDKLWKVLGGITTIKSMNLLNMCLIIMNLYKSNSSLVESNNENNKVSTMASEVQVYSQEEAIKIHKTFLSFYQNRRLDSKKRKPEENTVEECSFKPKINSESEFLAYDTRDKLGYIGSMKRDEYINQKKQDIEQKREKIKNKKEEKELSECTFKPQLNASFNKTVPNEAMNNNNIEKPLVIKERLAKAQSPEKLLKDQPAEEKKRTLSKNRLSPNKTHQFIEKPEDNIEGCFHPNLDKSKVKEQTDGFYSEKVQKEIQRMRKIREEKTKKNEKIESSPIKAHKRTNSCAENKKKDPSPMKNISFVSSASNQNRPTTANINKISNKVKKSPEKVKNKKITSAKPKDSSESDRKSDEEISYEKQENFDKNQNFIPYNDVEVVENSEESNEKTIIVRAVIDEIKSELPQPEANNFGVKIKDKQSDHNLEIGTASDKANAENSFHIQENYNIGLEDLEAKLHNEKGIDEIKSDEGTQSFKDSKSDVKGKVEVKDENYKDREPDSTSEKEKPIIFIEENKNQTFENQSEKTKEEKKDSITENAIKEDSKGETTTFFTTEKQQELLAFIKSHNLSMDSYEKLKEIFISK
ncbi:hypothetical protein SteCoe_32433 [Stentor coeruleus]|uniref:EF-hand domain-containing protein n=1 Tax=Stentor coeruleus TaxID=5963 RepID=A0A1R2AZ54_9CILI|nr:hypothetical protein SteCoe_32433 [Stentor coeruleus]